MNLTHLKTTSCPFCGRTQVVAETRDQQHCNGEYNETRTFECGYMVHFSPNYSKEFPEARCTKDIKWQIIKDKREKAKQVILSTLEALDVDATFKKELGNQSNYWYYFPLPPE